MAPKYLHFKFQEPGFKHYTIGCVGGNLCTKSLTECPVYMALVESKLLSAVDDPDKVYAEQLHSQHAVIVEFPSSYGSILMQQVSDGYATMCKQCSENQR